MMKLKGMILAVFAISAMALLAGCSGGGASTEAEIKKDMSNIDKGLEEMPELPEEAKLGPIPKGAKGGAAAGG